MIQRQAVQEKSQNTIRGNGQRAPWIEFCGLLALAQILIAGYRYGVANQSIQISILKHFLDPTLFASDALVKTVTHYPSLFFNWLAALLRGPEAIEPAYFLLHTLTTVGVACGAYLIAKGLTGRWISGLLALIILTAGHWAGLAESNLYTMEFTHTRAALSLSLLSIGLYLHRKHLPSFILLGLTFCIHPLMACYAGAILGVWLLADLPRDGWRELVVSALPAAMLSVPILAVMLADSQVFDAEWIRLVRIRSPHHVFPSTWWAPGNHEIPRFLVLSALAAICLSSLRLHRRALLRIGLLICVILGLFICGYVFTELLPIPIVMRAQLFRSSRFLTLIWIVIISHWCIEEVREVFKSRRHMFRVVLPAILVLVMAIPSLGDLLPAASLAMAFALLFQCRLTWWASAFTGITAICCVIAWRHIGFPLISLPRLILPSPNESMGLLLVATAIVLSAAYSMWSGCRERIVMSVASMMLLAAVLSRTDTATPSSADSGWITIQQHARMLTPDDTMILVPPVPGGFRVHSDRSIVGEWRDGTQQFFDAEYAKSWWDTMCRLRTGLQYDERGEHVLARGLDFNRLSNERIEELCTEYGATHFVSKAPKLDFRKLAHSGDWTLYSAARLIHPPQKPPRGAPDAEIWAEQETFMRDVVYPNIERYRKSEASLTITDPDGHPLKGAAYEVRQTSSRFLFGSAMPNFVRPQKPQSAGNGGKIDDKYLARFKELFNFSIIGYAGKWNAIEGKQNEPWFDNLDKYVSWCTENGITIEYHFVSGYPPAWFKALSTTEKKDHLKRHSARLINRYGDRIRYWQIVNERHNLNDSPEIFRLFRKELPDAELGISNCARFYSKVREDSRRKYDMVHGAREMEWLSKQDIDLDFFAFHGHRPFGLWADVKEIYEGLDYCREYDVKVHISEFGMHLPHEMIGPVRTGKWTEELQAEYYRRYYTVCFSHPLVEAINLWGIGPSAWIKGGGLLDRKHEPKPAFHALKTLIHEEWRTSMEGKVPLDGRLEFRGFHGNYEITVTPKGASESFTAEFSVLPGTDNSHIISGKKANE